MTMDRREIFKENFERSFTWIEGFMRNVRRYGDHTAIFTPSTGERLSYSRLNARVNRLANALLECGLQKGDVVMYLLHNCSEFVLCYVAPQKIGAINCPINYYMSAGEIICQLIIRPCLKIAVH